MESQLIGIIVTHLHPDRSSRIGMRTKFSAYTHIISDQITNV